MDLTGTLAILTMFLTIFLSPSPMIDMDLHDLPALSVLTSLRM